MNITLSEHLLCVFRHMEHSVLWRGHMEVLGAEVVSVDVGVLQLGDLSAGGGGGVTRGRQESQPVLIAFW